MFSDHQQPVRSVNAAGCVWKYILSGPLFIFIYLFIYFNLRVYIRCYQLSWSETLYQWVVRVRNGPQTSSVSVSLESSCLWFSLPRSRKRKQSVRLCVGTKHRSELLLVTPLLTTDYVMGVKICHKWQNYELYVKICCSPQCRCVGL